MGTKEVVGQDGGSAVATRCPRCGTESSLVGRRTRRWFTLFLLPVFPLGRTHRFTQCGHCQARFGVPAEQFDRAAENVDAIQLRRAIGMYNSLRASPANAVTLNELMQLYAALGEYGQAASAAADFPDALQSSEQCMTTLGRVYTSMNRRPAAIGWFDRALARDADLGEAHYYKAVALLTADPPDRARAVTSARAAWTAGYPGAEKLLREAEAAEPDA